MLGRTDSRLRMVAVMLVFAVVAAAASVRLGYWQVVAAEDLTAQVEAVFAQREAAALESVRADIVDRDGRVLAKTSSFDSVIAYPNLIDPASVEDHVELLQLLLDLGPRDRAELSQTLTEGVETGVKWIRLSPRIEPEQGDRLREVIDEGLLPGIALEELDVRRYPAKGGEPGTTLASHVLGFVRGDSRGAGGVEDFYDERLTTLQSSLVDTASIAVGDLVVEGLDPEPLELTIDAKLQRAVEKELSIAQVANKAKSVSAIVMDPHSGAILAAASVPAYDAEDYVEIANEDPGRLRNRVFQDAYEPGSVMKIFTATAALDLGRVTPNTVVQDQRKLDFWKYTVRNADHKTKGRLKVKDVIALSRNVATAKIARMLAPTSTQKAAHRLYDLWEKVGLPGRTGADVAGEATGTWYDPDERLWSEVDLANRAFGQGVSVTLPQLARGIATLVNGGYRVQPHLAAHTELAQIEPERVLRAKTARQARDILKHVTGSVWYYAQGSLIPGYEVGGKTGTAQIWDVKKGKWKGRRFNHSFIGFVAGRKQEYVIAVRLEEPVPLAIKQGSIPLRIESYELFQMVARTTIKQMEMKRSKDPHAGRPIIGTDAAKRLDPLRNRQALQAEKRQERKAERQAAKAARTQRAARQDGGLKVASDPSADEGT